MLYPFLFDNDLDNYTAHDLMLCVYKCIHLGSWSFTCTCTCNTTHYSFTTFISLTCAKIDSLRKVSEIPGLIYEWIFMYLYIFKRLLFSLALLKSKSPEDQGTLPMVAEKVGTQFYDPVLSWLTYCKNDIMQTSVYWKCNLDTTWNLSEFWQRWLQSLRFYTCMSGSNHLWTISMISLSWTLLKMNSDAYYFYEYKCRF